MLGCSMGAGFGLQTLQLAFNLFIFPPFHCTLFMRRGGISSKVRKASDEATSFPLSEPKVGFKNYCNFTSPVTSHII